MISRDNTQSPVKGTQYHNKHEEMTQHLYENEGMLPHRYVFVLSNKCNLSCAFCNQNKNAEFDSMGVEDWKHVADQLPDYARVTITGGEPFLYKGFNEVFSYVAQRFPCNVISNGVLLTNETTDRLLSYPKFKVLSISIDDIGNTLRGFTEKKWKKFLENLSYFNEKRKTINPECIFDIKTLILDENTENLFDIHKFCLETIGCDVHSFLFLKGSELQHSDKMFPFEAMHEKSRAPTYKRFDRICEALNRVREYNIRYGKKSFLHPKVGSLMTGKELCGIVWVNSAFFDKKYYASCKYPWSSVHINSDGNLCPCLGISMGNVKTQSIKEIVNGDCFKKFRSTIRENGTVEACNRCGWMLPSDPVSSDD